LRLTSCFFFKREKVKPNVCEKFQCKPGAICIGQNEQGQEVPTCVCLNGQSTSDDCDKTG